MREQNAGLIETYVNPTGQQRWYMNVFNKRALRELLEELGYFKNTEDLVREVGERRFRHFGRALRVLCSMYNSGHVLAGLRMFDDDRHHFFDVIERVIKGEVPSHLTQVAISLMDSVQVLCNRLSMDQVSGFVSRQQQCMGQQGYMAHFYRKSD